ncbi:hypothetical protein [Streptomyces ipomoeae]|uniref:hypothetical protein n=1 Tax=Streptomyces ipomoeae TaxID=103232 RepID=UPI0029A90665|nr:hypothetical protein [Streptomyces ipomoeae]MDX2700337.1 hypothetical protein [Streptomyces ipomoeae]MDX2845961.1 hypothetical protein [Streptomyces ipomoeae]
MLTRPVLALRPGDRVRQPSGAWLTVAARPRPNPRGPRLTWHYVGGSTGTADWLAYVPCLPATRHAVEGGEC